MLCLKRKLDGRLASVNRRVISLIMKEILHHPAFGALLFCLLGTWPLARVYQRLGLHPAWAALLWLNLVLPGLGLATVIGSLCHRAWPNLPKPPAKWVKTTIWGQKSGEQAE